jgi:SAM-dependent methyltransferase
MRTLTRFETRIIPGQLRHAQRIIPHLTPYVHGRVLDFGNGSGAIAYTLARECTAHVVGVDVAQNSLFDIPAVAYDGEWLPFRDRTFDVVYAIFVLHHCTDVDKVLNECARVSKGRIILIEDVWTNWWNRFWMYFFHLLFDLFMVILTVFTSATWKTDFRYRFKDQAGWKGCFERLGLAALVAEDVVLYEGYPVRHRIYVLEKGGQVSPFPNPLSYLS